MASFVAGLSACSQTAAPAPNIIQRAQRETPAPPPPSGFLGADYSLLQPAAPGSGQKALLAYTNSSVNFASYNKIMIEPVTFWADRGSTISSEAQQELCDYAYSRLKEDLSKNFTVVDQPGPGVAKLSAALTDATSAVPVLRTIAVVVPQAHVLSLVKQGLTGGYSFVGSAAGEAKLTDSVSGQLLAAWADKRVGTGAVRNAGVWKWGDADNAIKYWGSALDERLGSLGIQQSTRTAEN
jgi:hypothetical protein